jgi:hypothetical protein
LIIAAVDVFTADLDALVDEMAARRSPPHRRTVTRTEQSSGVRSHKPLSGRCALAHSDVASPTVRSDERADHTSLGCHARPP